MRESWAFWDLLWRILRGPILEKMVLSFLLVGFTRAWACCFPDTAGAYWVKSLFWSHPKETAHARWETLSGGPFMSACYGRGGGCGMEQWKCWMKGFQNSAPGAWRHPLWTQTSSQGTVQSVVWPLSSRAQCTAPRNLPPQASHAVHSKSWLWRAESSDIWSSTHFCSFKTKSGK